MPSAPAPVLTRVICNVGVEPARAMRLVILKDADNRKRRRDQVDGPAPVVEGQRIGQQEHERQQIPCSGERHQRDEREGQFDQQE
jgi:hypothetical protein